MISIFLALAALLHHEARTSKVVLRVEGLKDFRGEVRIAVFNSEGNYAKSAYALAVVPVNGGVCEWEFPSLQYGEYAVAVYHDVNLNRKLDTNLVGAPTERYGFSNNARGLFGPPSWDKARFRIDRDRQFVAIEVK